MANTDAEGGLLNNLRALLESGDGADVTLVVGDSELLAHSFILAMRSPVFAAMLKHDLREAHTRRIEIADVQEAVLREMLCFMYTDTVPHMDSMVAELLSAADKYDVPLLKKRCEQAMARTLTVDNAAATAVLAELHSCPLLKSATADFIAGHPQVMVTEGWINVMRGNVEATAQICKQVALATPSSQNRILSKEHKNKLAWRLLKAATEGSVGEIRALVDAGAPIDVEDCGDSALHLAAMSNSAAAVKILIDAGADVNVRNFPFKQTPLHKAAVGKDVNTLWLLLLASACKDAQDKYGKTPLHLATAGYSDKYKEQATALLLAGADSNIKDTSGCIPCVNSSTRALFDTIK